MEGFDVHHLAQKTLHLSGYKGLMYRITPWQHSVAVDVNNPDPSPPIAADGGAPE